MMHRKRTVVREISDVIKNNTIISGGPRHALLKESQLVFVKDIETQMDIVSSSDNWRENFVAVTWLDYIDCKGKIDYFFY